MDEVKILSKDEERVKLLLVKFSPRILRLAVNFISFDSTVQELQNYLIEHKDSHPGQRDLFQILSKLDEYEENELVTLSRNIANNNYDLDKIIPLV